MRKLLVGFTVQPLANNQLRVNYTRGGNPLPLDLNRWRCTNHTATNRENCAAALPVDVNQNLTSNSTDVSALRDLLLPATVTAPPYQCDLDRSTRCTPLDLLTAVDLLNGADSFTGWNNAVMLNNQTCPSQ